MNRRLAMAASAAAVALTVTSTFGLGGLDASATDDAAQQSGAVAIPSTSNPSVVNFTATGTFSAPASGRYKIELLGAGGGGGSGDWGWSAGGGGGGGAYAAGVVALQGGDTLSIRVGEGGVGAQSTGSRGSSGGASKAVLNGSVLITAGGGNGGSGGSGAGGQGGDWSIADSLTDAVGFAGGNGGNSVIRASFSNGYHQGGEGGSAANSTGAGIDGTTQRCIWKARAIEGSLPSGAGGIGVFPGYDGQGACGTGLTPSLFGTAGVNDLPFVSGLTSGGNFGGGGGASKQGGANTDPAWHDIAGNGGGGYARITRIAPSAPDGVGVRQSGTIAAVSWSAVSGVDSYRAVVSPGGASCESTLRTCTISGLVRGARYAVQVFAVDGGVSSDGSLVVPFVAGDSPGSVSNVTVAPGSGTAVVAWTTPTFSGDAEVTSFRVESAPGGLECIAIAPSTECELDGLTNGVPYLFTVYARNAVGEGSGVVSPEAVAFSWPGTPSNLRAGLRQSNFSELRWDAAASNGSAVTGYILNVSRDGGATWSEYDLGVVTKANVPELTGPAQAAWVAVAAVNARGRSAFSDPVLVTTTGVKSSVRVAVVDSSGEPVIGGAITWEMVNGAAKSSKTYGLTDDGVIDFPLAPAGAVDVTVTGALTAEGATVSGTFHGYLGFTSTVLQLPEAPIAARSVTVELPNGLPVPGVAVALNPDEGQYQDTDCLEWAYGDLGPNDFCLDGSYGPPSKDGGFSFSKTVGGFMFTVPRVAETLTDANGRVVLTGFTNGQPRVDVSYDDGIITQAKSVVLRNVGTVVQLDYMPWVEVDADALPAILGAPLTIPVSIATDTEAMTRGKLIRANQGIKVTVLPPAGAPKGTCKARLTAATNSAGKASLTVCATKSGMYRFKTEGAAAVDGVLLKVRGAAPMSPTAVTVRSLSVGTAKASWNPPAYDGGSVVTNYVVTATAKGRPTVTKTVTGTVKSINLTGLSNATKYTVQIQAKTAKGLSDPVSVVVPVA